MTIDALDLFGDPSILKVSATDIASAALVPAPPRPQDPPRREVPPLAPLVRLGEDVRPRHRDRPRTSGTLVGVGARSAAPGRLDRPGARAPPRPPAPAPVRDRRGDQHPRGALGHRGRDRAAAAVPERPVDRDGRTYVDGVGPALSHGRRRARGPALPARRGPPGADARGPALGPHGRSGRCRLPVARHARTHQGRRDRGRRRQHRGALRRHARRGRRRVLGRGQARRRQPRRPRTAHTGPRVRELQGRRRVRGADPGAGGPRPADQGLRVALRRAIRPRPLSALPGAVVPDLGGQGPARRPSTPAPRPAASWSTPGSRPRTPAASAAATRTCRRPAATSASPRPSWTPPTTRSPIHTCGTTSRAARSPPTVSSTWPARPRSTASTTTPRSSPSPSRISCSASATGSWRARSRPPRPCRPAAPTRSTPTTCRCRSCCRCWPRASPRRTAARPPRSRSRC